MTKDEALRMALAALDRVMSHGAAVQEAKDILRAAIEQAPMHYYRGDEQGNMTRSDIHVEQAQPPCREWVGLTADEIWDEWFKQTKSERDTQNFVAAFARAIEAKLKEKNT